MPASFLGAYVENGHLRRRPVRVARHRGRRRADPDRAPSAGAQRASRISSSASAASMAAIRLDRLLRRDRPRLRVVLALPRADRAPRGGAGGARARVWPARPEKIRRRLSPGMSRLRRAGSASAFVYGVRSIEHRPGRLTRFPRPRLRPGSSTFTIPAGPLPRRSPRCARSPRSRPSAGRPRSRPRRRRRSISPHALGDAPDRRDRLTSVEILNRGENLFKYDFRSPWRSGPQAI